MSTDAIAIIAMIISIIGAIVSGWQAAVAKKTLKNTIVQQELLNPKIDLFIIKSAQNKNSEYISYIIDCSIFNKSRSEDSIFSASLIINYKNTESLLMRFKCEHSSKSIVDFGVKNVNATELPVHLNPNDVSNTTFLFQVNNNVFNGCSIIDYSIQINSATGILVERNIPLIPFLEK
jgi:hypothetical protein